ncbi:MAG: Hsp20/alpha crystallin family protein [Treponema sp.]|jgi:HSP20 family molecular chaperone IbpA|nr:Hsp20/alpha crystallin family protein [Treponema sp.]
MKGARSYMDLGTIFDEIFEAAQDFKDEFHRNFHQYGNRFGPDGSEMRNPFGPFGKNFFDENTDFYPNYSYPPMNVCMTGDRSLVFEFALAGFDEKDISLSFQGDYMVFSAALPKSAVGETGTAEGREGPELPPEENLRYLKRRLKMKNIEKQKYYVPLDKYAQDKVKAVYKNGILRVSIPPKDEPDQNDGIRIEIVKEGT